MASAGRRCLLPCILGILLNALIGELRVFEVVFFVCCIFSSLIAGLERTLARDELNLSPVCGTTSTA